MFDAFILFLFWLFGIYGLMCILTELSSLFMSRGKGAKPIYVIDCDSGKNPEEEILQLSFRLAKEKGGSSAEIWLLAEDPSALPKALKSKASAVLSKEQYNKLFL